MRLHWRAKMAAKILLSRVPLPYAGWRRLSVFRLGEMDDPSYAIEVFERHFKNSSLQGTTGFTALELGPGDSVASAVIARAHGARKTYLVDVGAFATTDMRHYQRVAEALDARGMSVPDLSDASSVDEVLERVGGHYVTDGLDGLRRLASDSVDFVWSHAVLEHVARGEFEDTVHELSRVLTWRGRMSHRIDFQDHLAGSLNNLRFSERRWESNLLRKSGFYTNRLRPGEVLAALRRAGLTPKVISHEVWEDLPVRRSDLSFEFRQMEDRELIVRGFDVVATCQRYQSEAQMSGRIT